MFIVKALTKLVGTRNDREIAKLIPLVQEINKLDPVMRKLSDKDLQAQTPVLKQKLAQALSLTIS